MADDTLKNECQARRNIRKCMTLWAGKVQQMTFSLGIPKGMKKILEECGTNTDTLNADQILCNHHDDTQKSIVIIPCHQSNSSCTEL